MDELSLQKLHKMHKNPLKYIENVDCFISQQIMRVTQQY